MHLRTTESTADRSIELAHTAIVLYDADAADDPDAPFPSSFPFAIPLTADTPQCIHTPQSALAHVLSATLHPADPAAPPLTKALAVHTRRFSSHTHTPAIAPVTRTIAAPARVDVEVPRTTFTAREPVPIYVTVPSPSRELVVQGGLRLRNIKAELVRTVRVRQGDPNDDPCAEDGDENEDDEDDEDGGRLPLGVSHEQATEPSSSSSQATTITTARRRAPTAVYKTVVSRSGALCRFHTSLPVRLRFVLHQSSPASSPSDPARPLPAGDFGLLDSDAECGSITQTTLLHSVAFRLRVHVTFRNMATRTEHVSTLALPLTFLPPPAPLPELEAGMDSAYHKKHDRPPARTVRGDDQDAAPHYEEGEAGPSVFVVSASGEPPPFEERDAPPSFAEASTSSRLPTFLESEQEIYIPPRSDDDDEPSLPPPPPPGLPAPQPQPRHVIDGEGVLFGFPASAHFDGHAEDVDRTGAPTPPPTLEMATHDPDVTGLADLDLDMGLDMGLDLGLDLDAPGTRAMQALGLGLGIALEQREETTARGPPPPPPPPMDDPSDPPPSIHSEYRSREGVPHQMPGAPASSPPPPHHHHHHHHLHNHHSPPQQLQPPATGEGGASASAHPHAPPPYLIPDDDDDGEGGHEHVARPPPYVDVMHEH